MKRSKPLHLVILVDAWFPFYGGGQVHVKNLSDGLVKRHHCQVRIFYPQSSSLLSRLAWSFVVVPQVLKYSRSHSIDLLHSHGFIPGLPAKILSLILNKPVVHTVHGSHLMDQGKAGLKAWLEKFLLTKINYTAQITVSGSFLKYPNVNREIHVIPNGVDIKAYNLVKVTRAKQPTILFVGRRHPDKGIDILLKAYILARQKIPGLKLDIVDGGVTGKNLIRRYKRAHLFVLPSRAEGQPISLLEAWAARLPVIVTTVGDNSRFVKHGVNGYLIEPDNPDRLARHIVQVFKDYSQAEKKGQAGYQFVKQNHSWDKITDQTYQVYLSLLK